MRAGARTTLQANLAACAQAGVTLVEQPLPAGRDQALARIKRPIPVCADESVHGLASLPALAGKYDAVNIKLDKAGGLTEALAMAEEAERLGFAIMAGCMVATSLAMAPAMLLAQKRALRRSRRAAAAGQGPPGRPAFTATAWFSLQPRRFGAEQRYRADRHTLLAGTIPASTK